MLSKKYNKFLVKKIGTSIYPSYYWTKLHIKLSEKLSEKQQKKRQFDSIKKIITYAYENVPYYRQVFTEIGFKPSDFRRMGDIEQLPLMDKKTYRDNIEYMVSRGYPKKLMPTVFTGGTTGEPLMLYRSYGDYGRERAYSDFAYQALGMNPNVKTIYMRGKVSDEKGVYHKVSDFGRTLYLSSHQMTPDSLEEYIDLINAFKPVLFYVLPSVGTVFAEYILRKKITISGSLKWIFCPSENLYDFQKAMMEAAFKCKIGTFYGHAEHAVFAIKCDESDLYRMVPHYGYCELIDQKGRQITKTGQLGEIVGTSFTNQVSPLIRYRTGDFASRSEKKCPCGRNCLLLEKLQGREQSMAMDKRNVRINLGPELLCTIHDKSYRNIKKFWIEQRKAGELCVYIEPNEDTPFHEIKEPFRRLLEDLYPGHFDVVIDHAEHKPRDTRVVDKHLYFRQLMNIA